MLKTIKLLRLYPEARVDGYDVIDAADAMARLCGCSRDMILDEALKCSFAAAKLFAFARRLAQSA